MIRYWWKGCTFLAYTPKIISWEHTSKVTYLMCVDSLPKGQFLSNCSFFIQVFFHVSGMAFHGWNSNWSNGMVIQSIKRINLIYKISLVYIWNHFSFSLHLRIHLLQLYTNDASSWMVRLNILENGESWLLRLIITNQYIFRR